MSEALTLTARCLRVSRRQVDALLTSLLLPVLLMIVFVELFGGAIDTGMRYVTYVVPGVLLLCAGYSSGLTAVAVCQDMTGGCMDRLRSMNVRGAALLSGHVAASAARNLASAVLVLAIALLLGFHPHAGALRWLGAAGMLLAFIFAISWLSAAFGLLARSAEAAGGFTFLIMFLPYASSAFVPVHTMPGWLRGFAAHQPITPITESLRGLLLGTPVGANAWIGLAWCAGILAASIAASGVLFARRTA
ncbi:MAG TPA: ABC transporter permease [Solirubrobacteraceae bacterium]|nr:ABC transporter permease [Solirubrobacteraceae bacterium]